MAAKITRYNGDVKAFAIDALGTERTVFGEETQANDLNSQITADYLRGWGIVGPADQPSLQEFNAMGFALGQFIAYLHQVGVAEYNATQEYHLNSFTNSGGVLYVSLINSNVGNNPSASPAQWKELYGQATETFRGTGTVATQAEAEAGVSDTDLMTPLKVKQAIAAQTISADGIAGAASNLKASATGLSAVVSITADSFTVKNSSNQQKVLNSVSVTASFAVAGAGGLDVGAANSQTANTWYYEYVIWNPTTLAVNGLLSLSPTSPTLPAGFTHKGFVGPCKTDNTGNKWPLSFLQASKLWTYVVAATGNLTTSVSLATGAAGNASTPTWSAVTWTTAAPPMAVKLRGLLFTSSLSAQAIAAPNNRYGAYNATVNPPPASSSSGTAVTANVSPFEFVPESTQIFWAASGGGILNMTGFELP